METKFNGGDEVSLVSTISGKSGCFPTAPVSSNQRSSNKLAVAFGFAFLTLLCLLLVVVIFLLHQNTVMSSLTEQVQDLHGNFGILNEKITNLSKSIGREGFKSKHALFNRIPATEAPPVEDNNIQPEILNLLEEVNTSIRILASNMKPDAGNFPKDFESVKSGLQEIKELLNESNDSVYEIEETLIMNWNKAFTNLSNEMTITRESLSNIMSENIRGVNVTEKVKIMVGVLTGVGANVTKLSEFIMSVDKHLSLLHDKCNTSSLATQLENISESLGTIRLERNKPLCSAADLQPIRLQGVNILNKVENMSSLQMPLLLQSQSNVISEMKKELDVLRKELKRSKCRNGSTSKPPRPRPPPTTAVNETFCKPKDQCVNRTVDLRHCYLVSSYKSRLSWNAAKYKCQNLGGYLAEINSISEMHYLSGIVNRWNNYWLGANDLESEGTWFWQKSRQSLSLHSWSRGEPNNLTQEHCLHSYHGIGRWHDAPCSRRYGYICEKNHGKCWW